MDRKIQKVEGEEEAASELWKKLKAVLVLGFLTCILGTVQFMFIELTSGLIYSIFPLIIYSAIAFVLHPLIYLFAGKTRHLKAASYFWAFLLIGWTTISIHYLNGIFSFVTLAYIPIILAIGYMLEFKDIIITASCISVLYVYIILSESLGIYPTHSVWGIDLRLKELNATTLVISLSFNVMMFYISALIIGTLSKITGNQKRIITESEKRLRDILMNSADWVWEVDREGKYSFVSGRVKDVLGYGSEELIGKTPFDLMGEDEAKRVGLIFQELVVQKKPISNLENWNVSKDGRQVLILTNGVPILAANGELMGYRGVDKDITDLRKLEQERMHTITEKAEIIELMIDGIVVADLSMRLTYANNALLKMYEYEKMEEIIGKLGLDFFSKSDHAKIMERVKDSMVHPGPRINSYMAVTKTGREFPVLTSIVIKKDANGKPVEFITVVRDISAIRESENKLQRAEKLAAVGQLSSSIAHELRNPLGSIKNAQYFLKNRLKEILDPEKHKMELKFIDGIAEQVNSADRIITDLLDFSRQRHLKPSPAQMKPIVEKVLESVPVPAKIKITRVYSQEDDILVDSEQLAIAFRNIINNAIQSMEEKEMGELRIKISPALFESGKKGVEISFKDSGCGIPEKIRDKVFEPLVSTKIKGTGLGLAIVSNIIKAHNGKILFESKEGEGTEFRMTLPAEQTNA